MSQIENNFIYDDKGVVANLVKPFERKDRFPSDKTTVFGSYNAALDYANNNPSAYVGQIISVVDEGGDVKVYKLIPSSSGETGYATLKEIGEGGNTSIPPAEFDPPIVDLEQFATKLWVEEQKYITLDDIPEVAVPSKTSDLTNDSGFITINDVPKVTVPTKVSDLENDSNFITPDTISDIEIPQLEWYVGKSWAEQELVLNDNFVTFKDETYQEMQKIYSNIDAKANSSDVYPKGEVYTKAETNATFLSKTEAKGTYKVIDVFDDRILKLNENGLLSSRIELRFDSANQTLVLSDKNGDPISIVDISNVISSGFLKDTEYDDTNKTLVFTFITENGTETVTVNLGDIIKTYTPGEGIDITNNGEISISTSKLKEIQSMGADIVRVEGLVNTAQGGVDAIAADYLKGADKTELDGKITAAQSAAKEYAKDAVEKAHSHTNNTELNKIVDGDVAKWNGHVANTDIHVTTDDKAKWNEVSEKANQSELIAHTGDGDIHVTLQQKTDWQDATDAINAFLAAKGNTTEAIDTLKEIQDFLTSDNGTVKTLLDKVDSIEDSLAEDGDTAKAIAAAQSAANAAQDGVNAIAADYLKGADKTELEGKITDAQSAADKAQGGVDAITSELNKKYVSLEKFEELESKYTSLNNIVETLRQEVESLKNGNINVGNAITELKSGSDDIKIERNGSVVTITLDDITNVTFGDGEDIDPCGEDCFDDCDDCGDSPWPPCSEDNEVCDEDNESY